MTANARAWFRFENNADNPKAVDIHIFSEIGKSYYNDDAVDAGKFVRQLPAADADIDTINVRINSPGGNPFDAIAMANALKAQKDKGRTVNVYIEGFAASAATIVSSAGTNIYIADNAMMFVHNPYTVAAGNAGELRKTANALDGIRDAIVATYRWVSSLSEEKLIALLDADTWMGAADALENGFVTEIIPGVQASACFTADVLNRMPAIPEQFREQFSALIKTAEPAPAPKAAMPVDVMRLCREAGCADLAEELVAANSTTEQVAAKLTAAKAERDAEVARAAEIRALCGVAKAELLADGYIAGRMPVDQVRAQLQIVRAYRDQVTVDGTIVDPGAAKTKSKIDTTAIYAGLNRK